MSIRRESRFLIDRFRDHHLQVKNKLPEITSIGLESRQLDACVSVAVAGGYAGVFGSPYFGFHEDTLDVLERMPALEKIWFWDVEFRNIDGVYALSKLREFRLPAKRPGIDFSRLPTLENLTWNYNAKDMGIGALKLLKRLYIWHHNPKSRSLADIEIPESVEELQLNWINADSLQDLPPLTNLRRFEIHRSRNLTSIAEIPRIAPNLEYVVVHTCPRVADGEAVLRQMPKLEHGYVQGVLARDLK